MAGFGPFAAMPGAFVGVVIALLLGLGLVFLALRVPGPVRQREGDLNTAGQPLTRRQRMNVGLTLVVSQALQVVVVSSGVGGFFVAFGVCPWRPRPARRGWGRTPRAEMRSVFEARTRYPAVRSASLAQDDPKWTESPGGLVQ